MLLTDRGVAMVTGGAVAGFLLVILLIESLAENSYHPGGVMAKLGGASLSVVAALLAPVLTVPGSVLVVGFVLATLVVYGVVLQHRLHVSESQLAS